MSYADPQAHTMAVLDQVLEERARQDAKWGEQNHPDGTGAMVWHDGRMVADENVLEVRRDRAAAAKTSCDNSAAAGQLTYRHILEEEVREAFAEDDKVKLRAELVQVAAVAVAWVEKLDREAAR